ncbi:MAG: SUMF1/EgtB/PvdO family nonheme iron enzyme [Bryobacteraceae bacterium]
MSIGLVGWVRKGPRGLWPRLIVASCLASLAIAPAADRKAAFDPNAKEFTNSIGIRLVRIPAGQFRMGSQPGAESDYDEQPAHLVAISHDFFLAETEITVRQFQEFRMDYQDTGRFSPFVTGVSWDDAAAFCGWLAKKEHLPYRLPTEAEWEYAARAKSAGAFAAGETPLPAGRANAFGVENMESEAPEWVRDWYGPYGDEPETDPVGPADGIARVVRGGGIMGPYSRGPSGFEPRYRRDANRAGMIPAWEGQHPIGFRIVLAPLPATAPRKSEPRLWQQFVKQTGVPVKAGPDPAKPWFRQRNLLPAPPEDMEPDAIAAAGIEAGILGHNHSGGVAVMPNGDMLAIDFSAESTSTEYLPNTTFVAFRRRFGSEQWDMPEIFYDFADVNEQSALLWNDNGTIRFFGGGVGLTGVPFRMQVSTDSGAHWTPPAFPLLRGPAGGFSPQPITSAFRGADRRMYVATDAVAGESMLWASDDDGRTWVDTGGRTGGRHTAFVVLKDGGILGMGGKNTDIDGFMPKSVSRDGGRTWQIGKTQFPALGSNQRPTIVRLASGRLFFASDWQSRTGEQPAGITSHGAFVALSGDEGSTWRIRTIPGALPHEAHVLPKRAGWAKDTHGYATLGYTVAAQGPDGLIHLVTSMNHPAQEFEMNEAWILSGNGPAANTEVKDHRDAAASQKRSGRNEAEWSGYRDASGRYLLDGPETWFYPSGAKRYQVTWQNGLKIGAETYWAEDGRKRWEWERLPGGNATWTQYWPNGNRKHLSHWRNGECEGEAVAYDPSGAAAARFQFEHGFLRRR